MARRVLMLLLVASVCVTLSGQSKPPAPSIVGVWRVAEVTTTGPNASTTRRPQPGLYIFTGKHYSFARVAAMTPRQDLPDASKATAAELRGVWGDDGFVSNSGTYQLAGTLVTTHPVVAKNPTLMKPGVVLTYAYAIDGSTLTLTERFGLTGAVTNPTTIRLTRVE